MYYLLTIAGGVDFGFAVKCLGGFLTEKAAYKGVGKFHSLSGNDPNSIFVASGDKFMWLPPQAEKVSYKHVRNPVLKEILTGEQERYERALMGPPLDNEGRELPRIESSADIKGETSSSPPGVSHAPEEEMSEHRLEQLLGSMDDDQQGEYKERVAIFEDKTAGCNSVPATMSMPPTPIYSKPVSQNKWFALASYPLGFMVLGTFGEPEDAERHIKMVCDMMEPGRLNRSLSDGLRFHVDTLGKYAPLCWRGNAKDKEERMREILEKHDNLRKADAEDVDKRASEGSQLGNLTGKIRIAQCILQNSQQSTPTPPEILQDGEGRG